MSTIDTYNRIAEEWHRDHQDDNWWTEGTDTFIGHIGPGGLVLDIGCAGGFKSRYLLNHGLEVFGIDAAKNFIAIARREVPEARFAVMDMYDLSKLEESFDGVFMQASLLHIPKKDAAKVIKDASQKLKIGGYFYIAVKASRAGRVEEEIKTENDYGYPYERFFSYYSLDELKRYLADAGMETVYENEASSGSTTWIQVIGKKKK